MMNVTDPTINQPHHDSNKLSAGAIAGTVIGVVVGLVLLACVVFLLLKRFFRRPQSQPPTLSEKPPIEIDNGERDPYSGVNSPVILNKDHPHSPELGTTPHKGHELHGSAYFDQTPITGMQPVELAATERQSRTLSSPISLMSEVSGPNSPIRLHSRQPSDPVSVTSPSSPSRLHSRHPSDPTSVSRGASDASRLHSRQPSETASVTRERSDATRLHKREMSDPVSILSEGRDEGGGSGSGQVGEGGSS